MVRNLVYFALVVILVFQLPVTTSADTRSQFCPLDGYLSGSFVREAVAIEAPNQPLVLQFVVHNDSTVYSYGGVTVGVGLYESDTATTPAFWSPVLTDALFTPSSEQRIEATLDVTHVPAGEYVARLGVAQGGQLAALANSRNEAGIVVSKTVTGSAYPTSLRAITQPTEVGELAEYELLTSNDTDQVKRDYPQAIALVRGDTPLGSAVIASVSEPVKMIPGTSEETTVSNIIATDGEYTVFGFSGQPETLLPVVTSTFTVGDTTGPDDAHLVAIGISSLDELQEDILEVVACVAPVAGDRLGVMQIQQTVRAGDVVLNETSDYVSDGGFVSTRVTKASLETATVETKLFSASNQVSLDRTVEDESEPTILGILEQTVTQSLVCGEGCQPQTVSQALESFAAEKTFQNTIWFYLGIILAALLLMVLMIGRLTPPDEKEHEPMHEPE